MAVVVRSQGRFGTFFWHDSNVPSFSAAEEARVKERTGHIIPAVPPRAGSSFPSDLSTNSNVNVGQFVAVVMNHGRHADVADGVVFMCPTICPDVLTL